MQKQDLSSSVLIPLAELTQQSSQLLEIYAVNQLFGESDMDHRAVAKNWEIVAASLRSVYLYPDAHYVVTLLRKLILPPAKRSIYQRIKKYAWLDNQRLHVGSGLATNYEGQSAQLGLALVILMNASDCPYKRCIATGKLRSEIREDADIAVEAVSSIPEKLNLIIEQRQKGNLTDKHLYCFTPLSYKQDGEDYPVVNLEQVNTLKALNIEVVPIEKISEAQKFLSANKTRMLKQDKVFLSLLAGVLTFFFTFATYSLWWHQAIPFELLPIEGKTRTEPFLICLSHDLSKRKYFELKHDGEIPVFPLFSKRDESFNSGLAFKIKAKKSLLSSRYYVAFIHLGEQSGYQLLNKLPKSAEPLIIEADGELDWYWQMKEEEVKEQNNIVLVVMQRTPIDSDAINQAFTERFPDKNLDLIKARDYLLIQFPGKYEYFYKSIVSNSPCISS